MSPKGLNDLELKNEALPESVQAGLDDLPEFGGFSTPPQPGPYRFQMPEKLADAWDTFDVAGKGQRLKLILDRTNPLLITLSPGNKLNGDHFQTQISNAERKRGKDGPEASDMDYLLKAFKEITRPKLGDNPEYAKRVLQHVGKQFGADIRWTWFCNDKKNIWVYQGEGEAAQLVEVESHPGCGRRYYQAEQTKKDDQKIERQADGTYPLQITCVCGGVVRAFANLDNIRS